jgi:hypothetical protein
VNLWEGLWSALTGLQVVFHSTMCFSLSVRNTTNTM